MKPARNVLIAVLSVATVYILGQAIFKLQTGLISIEFEQISTYEHLFPSFSFCMHTNVGRLEEDYNYTDITVGGKFNQTPNKHEVEYLLIFSDILGGRKYDKREAR